MCQIRADHHTNEDGPNEELLLLQYNPYNNLHKQYQYMCKEGYNTLCWYCPPDYTTDLNPTGAGAVNQVLVWIIP